MATDPREFRMRILETLALIADFESQATYQCSAPSVDVAAELFNQWDDWYHPMDPAFQSQFDDSEQRALSIFGALVDRIASETPKELPPLSEFVRSDPWLRLQIGARDTLAELVRNQS